MGKASSHFQKSSLSGLHQSKKKKKRMMFEDDHRPYVVELDEETDLDMKAILSDRAIPPNMEFVNTHVIPGEGGDLREGNLDLNVKDNPVRVKEIKVMRRVKIPSNVIARGGINPIVSGIFQEAYARLCFPLRSKTNCKILGLSHRITVVDDSTIEIFFIAMSHYVSSANPVQDVNSMDPTAITKVSDQSNAFVNQLSLALSVSAATPQALEPLIPLEAVAFQKLQLRKTHSVTPSTSNIKSLFPVSNVGDISIDRTPSQHVIHPLHSITSANLAVANVILTSLSYIPDRKIAKYLGPLQLHFIKESWGMNDKILLNNFFYIFQSEVDAAARAQVSTMTRNYVLYEERMTVFLLYRFLHWEEMHCYVTKLSHLSQEVVFPETKCTT